VPAAVAPPEKPASHQREQVIQSRDPRGEIIIGQHEPASYQTSDHEVLLEY
jgi:hypothetical protein